MEVSRVKGRVVILSFMSKFGSRTHIIVWVDPQVVELTSLPQFHIKFYNLCGRVMLESHESQASEILALPFLSELIG